jgi:hypothetical protein
MSCPPCTEQDLRRAITVAKRNLTRASNATPDDTQRLALLEQQLDTAFRRLDAFLSQQPDRQPWAYLVQDAA